MILMAFSFIGGCSRSEQVSLPEGLSYSGDFHGAKNIKILSDITYINKNNDRISEQTIFNEVFQLIDLSNRFILIDMFLFNDFKGKLSDVYRPLSEELTDTLIRKKEDFPDCEILLITDPINTVYGGLPSLYLQQLEQAGISVVITKLDNLPDSNPFYSFFWRSFKLSENNFSFSLPNPFGEGRVSLSNYLELLNFKANHRKVVVGIDDKEMTAIIGSANPHDGSSAHSNIAVKFSGNAVADLIESELAVLKFSGKPLPEFNYDNYISEYDSNIKLKIITESAIKKSILSNIENTQSGDAVDLAMFYLSERKIIDALKVAKKRGVIIRVLMDPNKDAFGLEKNGIPNRQVGYELVKQGIPVRWCNTRGEQCHSKVLIIHRQNQNSIIILGSANFTRRNLDDFNLETNVELQAERDHPVISEAHEFFEKSWYTTNNIKASVEYEIFKDESFFKYWQYRFMEATGLSTF